MVCESILDVNKAIPFAEAFVMKDLNRKITHKGMLYGHRFCSVEVDWPTIFLALRKIAIILDYNYARVPLERYSKIVEILAQHNGVHRTMLINIIESKIGKPIVDIAVRSDIKNVSWLLARMKLANLVPLLHAVFSSNTLKGKLTSIVRILELYDLLWQDIAWGSIDKMAEVLFLIVQWMMEKCEQMKLMAKDAVDWVSLKKDEVLNYFKNHGEGEDSVGIDAEKQASPSIITCTLCSQTQVVGCSLCLVHLCESCRAGRKFICKCERNTNFIHLPGDCDCGNNQDCLFRAVAEKLNVDVITVKQRIWTRISRDFLRQQYENYIMDFPEITEVWQNYDEWKQNCTRQLKVNELCETDMLIAIGFVYNANVYMYDDNESGGDLYLFPAVAPKYAPFILHRSEYHFETGNKNLLELNIDYLIPGRKPSDNFVVRSHKTEKLPEIPPNLETQEKIQPEIDSMSIISNSSVDSSAQSVKTLISAYLGTSSSDSERPTSVTGSLSDSEKPKNRPVGVCNPIKPVELPADIQAELASPTDQSFWDLIRDLNFSEAGTRVADWFKGTSKILLTWFESNPFFSGCIALFITIAGFLGFNVVSFSGDPEAIGAVRKFSEASRNMYFTQRGLSAIVGSFTGVLDSAKDILGIHENENVEEFKKEVAELYSTSNLLLADATNNPGHFINNGKNFLDFKRHMEIIQKTYSKLATMKDTKALANIQPIWVGLNKTYEKLALAYSKLVSCAQSRQEPVVVYLFGATNIGKSQLTDFLIYLLRKMLAEPGMKVFTVSHGPTFWNGYAQQDVIRMDDMNAVIGIEGDTDSVTLFNLASCAAYNPNMASLEDKNIMFNGRFIFVCSNHPTLPSESTVSRIDAWERRRDFFVHVTFPEHEANCPPGRRKCKCWDNKTTDNFDHLELRLCDPIVTKDPNYRQKLKVTGKPSFRSNAAIKDVDEIDETGQLISPEQLIKMVVAMERENKEKFERSMRRSVEIECEISKQANSWIFKPHVIIQGPPGTGKSYIMTRYKEKNKTIKVCNIDTVQQFDEWASKDFTLSEPGVVMISDLSIQITSSNFTKFIQKLHQRNEESLPPPDVWIMGSNRDVLDIALYNINESIEFVDMFYRRSEIIDVSFKKTSAKDLVCKRKRYYDRTDIVDPKLIDRYVKYKYKGKPITQESVVTLLLGFKPSVEEIVNKNYLSIRETVKATTTLRVPLPEHEFLNMINNMKILEIIRFLIGSDCKCHSSSGMSVKQLSKIILNIISKAKERLTGTDFMTVADLLLQSWNANLFGELKDEVLVLHLDDVFYYIDYTGKEADCGKLVGQLDDMKDALYNMQMTVETIQFSTLMSGSSQIIPHWFVLAGEILSKISSVVITTLSATASVQDQQEMFKAQEMWLKIQNIAMEGANNVQEAAVGKLLNVMNTATGKHKIKTYPGEQFPKAPQYGDITNFESKPKTFLDRFDPDNNILVKGEFGEDTHEPKSRKSPKPLREFGEDTHEDKFLKKYKVNRSMREYTYNNFQDLSKTKPVKDVKFQIDISKVRQEAQVAELIKKEVATDPSLYPIIQAILGNCVEITSISGHRLCSGLVVRGHTVRTVHHLKDDLPISSLRVRLMDGRIFRVKELYVSKSYDRLDLLIDDKTCPQFRDITMHFPTLHSNVAQGTDAVLVTPDLSILHGVVTVYIRSYKVGDLSWKNFQDFDTKLHVIDYRGVRVGYRATGVQTKNGDCGSVLIVADPTIDKKVIGIHFAATHDTAFASPLRADQYLDNIVFQNAASKLDSKYFVPCSVDTDSSVIARCTVKTHIPTKTKLYRNVEPIGEKKCEPSILSAYDERRPGVNMLGKEARRWCKERPVIPASERDELRESMRDMIEGYSGTFAAEGVELRVLTSTEALNKMSGTSASEPINIHTSAGFPWSILSKKKGKTGYIVVGLNGERRFTNNPEDMAARTQLQSEMNKLENVDQCKDSSVIFQVFLKDELVKLEKIYGENPKTRTIAVIPLHALIVFRKYFHSMHSVMMQHWDKIGPKVGINPMSMDWHLFATNLLSVSTMGIDLDFSGWDFSHPPFFFDLLHMFYDTMYQRFDPNYTSKHGQIRANLYSKIKCFELLIGNTLHKSTGGLPSGYPGTTPDNSIINEFMMYHTYKMIMRKVNPSCANWTSFREDVALGTYGDDVIMAISQWASTHYNGMSIAKMLAPLGFTVQSSSKTQDIEAIKPIVKCTFLSRRFEFKNGKFIGPLKEDNLYKPTHYSSDRRSHNFWESPDDYIASSENILNVYDSILYNAALDTDEVFNRCFKAACKVTKMYNGPPPPTKNDCLARMFGYVPIKDRIIGLTFHDMPEVLKMNLGHPMPKYYELYKNRVCYQYGVSYKFGGRIVQCNPIPGNLQKLLNYVNTTLGKDYNSFLINVYPPGGEIPWHKDSEAQLDKSQGVFGITLSGDGRIRFKDTTFIQGYYLDPGLGYLMDEYCLTHYQHMRNDHMVDTVTITFRKLVPPQ